MAKGSLIPARVIAILLWSRKKPEDFVLQANMWIQVNSPVRDFLERLSFPDGYESRSSFLFF